MAEPVVTLLETEWDALDELLSGLTPEDWDRPALPGWTVKDCVSHIIGTESMLAGRNVPPAPEAFGDHVRNDIGKSNEAWVEHYRSESPEVVLAAFRDVTAERSRQLAEKTTAEFDAPSWTPRGQATYRDFMEVRVFDCWTHEQDIRRAIDRPDLGRDEVVAQAFAEMRRALPYVVGKLAGAPQGSTVVFAIEGSPVGPVAVGVHGRAAFLDAAPPDPTVRLGMDFDAFVVLAGGRGDAAVVIEGDADLGNRVVENLGFVI